MGRGRGAVSDRRGRHRRHEQHLVRGRLSGRPGRRGAGRACLGAAGIVIGQECVVTQRIDNLAGTGAVAIGGKIWTARSTGGETLELGTVVIADSIEGVKLMVTPVRQAQAAGTE